MRLKKIINSTVTVLFPTSCPVCWATPLKYPDIVCGKCRAHILNDPIPSFRKIPPISQVLTCAKNVNHIKETIKLFKYRQKDCISLLFPLIEKTLSTYPEHLSSVEIILPVPIHGQRLRKRGFNQTEVISRYISKISDKKIMTNNLIKTRNTVSQTELSRSKRLKNLENSFKIKLSKKIEGRSVLLVDDIITTGATLETCAEELIKAGASEIKGISLAYTP